MVLYAKLLAHVDAAVLDVLDVLDALEVVVADDDGALGVVAAVATFATADIDLVGRRHGGAAGERIHVRGFVGPVRGRVGRVGVGVGVLLALRDVAVRLAVLAPPVREQRGEERPHERDAGAHASDARLEHGPEEGRRD